MRLYSPVCACVRACAFKGVFGEVMLNINSHDRCAIIGPDGTKRWHPARCHCWGTQRAVGRATVMQRVPGGRPASAEGIQAL